MKTALLSLFIATNVLAQNTVRARAETTSIPSAKASDPALTSFIIGSDPLNVGLYLSNLNGSPSGSVPIGLVNSVDVRGSLVAASSPTGGIFLFRPGVGASLIPETPSSFPASSAGQLALGSLPDGGRTLWFDTSSDIVRHYALPYDSANGYSPTPVADVQLPGVPKGLAYDDVGQQLYATIPQVGVVAVHEDGGTTTVIPSNNGLLGSSLGGLGLYRSGNLVFVFTTSPNDDLIFVHALDTGGGVTAIGSLHISSGLDGGQLVRRPEFIDVVASIPGYTTGALLVHDGLVHNYKLVALADVTALLPGFDGGLGIGVDAGTQPTVDAGSSSEPGGGGPSRPGPSAPDWNEKGCSTTSLVALPALLLLWWIRRPRS